MMWDVISQHNPTAADKVHILGEKTNLPSPIIIATSPISKKILSQITSFRSTDKGCYFNGFTAANAAAIHDFQQQMLLASQHFHLKLE